MASEHADKRLVGHLVELLNKLALCVCLARVPAQPGKACAAALRGHDLGCEDDLVQQRRECACCGWVTELSFEEIRLQRGPDSRSICGGRGPALAWRIGNRGHLPSGERAWVLEMTRYHE